MSESNSPPPAEDQPATAANQETAEGPALSPAELQQELAKVRAELEESQRRSRDTQARLVDEHDRLLRMAAESENAKKRGLKEKEETRKFAAESLLKDFLPVADNLERALEHADKSDVKTLVEGVRLVQKLFETTLARHGVTGFSALGKLFDPNLHEALMQLEHESPPGTVVQEMARGYKLHDRLVRPAAVVVAKAAAPSADPLPS